MPKIRFKKESGERRIDLGIYDCPGPARLQCMARRDPETDLTWTMDLSDIICVAGDRIIIRVLPDCPHWIVQEWIFTYMFES